MNSLTRSDIARRSFQGGVHVCMHATGYCVYYDGLQRYSSPDKAPALFAAGWLLGVGALKASANGLDIARNILYDWTNVPLLGSDDE